MSITLQAHLTIHKPNRLAEKYVQMWRVYFTRQKKRVKIYSNAWWSPPIHLLVAACSHQGKSCRAKVQDLTYLCLMQLDSSLVYSPRSLEMLIRMNICLHMNYILGKMSCIKMLQASSGIQPLFQLMCTAKKLLTIQQGNVSPAGRHKLTWTPTNHKARTHKMNILVYNLVISGH